MIDIVKVKNRQDGNLKAHDILKDIVDEKTLLALSGGTSLDYKKMFVEPGDVMPGAICVVDERYGEPFHKDSNEFLLKEAGIKKFADDNCIETHKILIGENIFETEKAYDKLISALFKKFPKKVGVMGVGANLHTAGIFPYSAATKSADYVAAEEVEDKFAKRVTLTLKALGEFNNFVILMFGKEKEEAFKKILSDDETNMPAYPAIFYRKYPQKTYLITDINL